MPAMVTRPAVGSERVVQTLMVVLLPAPFGPEQAEELAALDGEVDALDGLDRHLAGIGLGESAEC